MLKLYGAYALKMMPKHLPYYLKKRAARKQILKMLPKNSVCAEIGVLTGSFSSQILRITKPDKLILIDPWRYGDDNCNVIFGHSKLSQADLDRWHLSVCCKFKTGQDTGKIEILRMRSQEASRYFECYFFDWIYIDGDHSYEGVRSDLNLYLPKVKRGGYMILDDYNRNSQWQSGVRRAVDEFLSEHPYIARKLYFNQLILQISN